MKDHEPQVLAQCAKTSDVLREKVHNVTTARATLQASQASGQTVYVKVSVQP